MVKKLQKNKAKKGKTTFFKRKRTVDAQFVYIEDLEYPSKWQRLLMIVANPYWYNMILCIIYIETMICLHTPILGRKQKFAMSTVDMYTIGIVLETFCIIDISFTVIAQYIVKLEFNNPSARPWYIIIFEAIGTIPFEQFTNEYDLRMRLAVIRTLRCVRLFYYFYKSRISLVYGINIYVLKFFCSIIFSQSVFAWVYFNAVDAEGSFTLYSQLLEIASSEIVGKGGMVSKTHHYSESIFLHEVPLSITTLLVIFIIIKPTLCDLIALLTMQYEDKFKYIYKVKFFENFMVKKYDASPSTKKTMMTYLRNYWDERQGCMENPGMENAITIIFPHSIIAEMNLESAYDVFLHAPVFRNIGIPIMRFLSLSIRNRLYMTGEYVYRKRAVIDFMVYIHRGNIDVLSKENGDAAIMTFTAGTVIGEASLICPFKSPVNVRCQTVCEISILRREDFLQVVRYYPIDYQNVFRMLRHRFRYTKTIYDRRMASEDNESTIGEQIIWLKANLHRLKSMDNSLMKYHVMKNIYLSSFLDRSVLKLDKVSHTKRYMEMLSIKQRNDINYDLVFVRSQCIWILKYDSPLYKIWDLFIAGLAFIMVLVQPYVIYNKYSRIMNIVVWSAYVIFFIDLLLSLITPPSKKSRSTTISEIFYERFHTPGLYLDLCSIIYFPILIHAIPFAKSDWMFILHTVKIWKVYRLLNKWENHFKVNLLLQKYCVFVLSFVIYVYTLGYVLLLAEVVDDPFSPICLQISSGVGFRINKKPLKVSILYFFINTFAVVFESLGVVTVTSANYMKYIRKGRIYKALQQLSLLAKKNPASQLFKRLTSFLNTQINDNDGFICRFDLNRFFNLPNYYSELLKVQIYATALKDLEFFKLVPREIIKVVSATAAAYTYHRHAVIMSYGAKYDNIYILIKGEARSVYGNKFYKTRSFVPLNLMEVAFGLPCVSNCIGLTEVTMVCFNYQTFLGLLQRRYPSQFEAINTAVRNNSEEARKILLNIYNGKQVVIKTKQAEHTRSFIEISTNKIEENSYEEYDYFMPFDNIYPFGFIRFLFMKRTITPGGRFLYWWEIIRCILSYTSSLVFFIPPLSLQSFEHPFTYVLIVLDLFALLDIYVRFHVCYYNEQGVLISHPLYTATHYFYSSFIVDLLGMLPLYLLVLDSPQYRIVFNIFHLLQIHRLVGFKNHFFYTTYYFDYIFLVISIILPVNLISCFIYMADCYDWNNHDDVNIGCKTFKKSSQLGNYITLSYFVVSTISCSGTGTVVDLEYVDSFILNVISMCSFVSSLIRIYVVSYLFGSYNKLYVGSHKIRDKIDRLMNFLRRENVQPYLRKQLKIYYELYWRWWNCVSPFLLLHNLNPALRRDMIYSLHGEHMQYCTSLEDNSNRLKNFFKNTLYHAKPLIIPKNGYILTVNDIQSNIYFLTNGSVDVVAANGTVIETIHDGSILGNLENKVYNRQMVSFVTNTVAKLLYIKAEDFYQIISYFPEIQRSFLSIKNRKLYYIHSKYKEDKYEETRYTPYELKKGFQKYHSYYILSWFHFIFSCCIGLSMELYQIAVGEIHYLFLASQYIFDLIHLVHQYLKFSTPYMTQEQEFVMHRLRIMAHSMGKRRIIYILYWINIPLDVPFLIVILIMRKNLEDWSLTFSILRLNRLTRMFNIIHIFRTGTKKVATFSKSFRIIMLFLFLVFSTQSICSLIAVMDYSYTRFMETNQSQIIRELPVKTLLNLRSLPMEEKMAIYTRYWFLSLLLHTFAHDDLYYPIESIFEMLFIVILLYATVFDSFIMVQYCKVLMESMALQKVVFDVRKYVNVYYRTSQSSDVLREAVKETISHYFLIKSVCDDFLLHNNSPRYLREATMMSIYGYLFKKNPYFAKAHPDFLRQLSLYMKNVAYPINSIILNRSDCVNTMYFVHKGEVAAVLYDNDCTSNAKYLYLKGDSFGYDLACKNTPSKFSYRTVTFCEVVELPWEKCLYLVDFFPLTKSLMMKAMISGISHYIEPTDAAMIYRRKRM